MKMRADADSALEPAPKLKGLEVKLIPELLKCRNKIKVTAEHVTFTCKSGTSCKMPAQLGYHDARQMQNHLKKKAKARKKGVDKLRTSKQSMLGKKAELCTE